MIFPRTEANFTNSTGSYTFVAGQPVYTYGDGREAFAHAIILGFSENGTYAKVARPYVYASGVGTTCPTPLLGAEVYECRVDQLKLIPGSYSSRVVGPQRAPTDFT